MNQSQALLVSLLLEVPLVLVIAVGLGWSRGRRSVSRLVLVSLAATLVTHPLAWMSFQALAPVAGYWPRVLLIEGGVALAEGWLYVRFAALGRRRGLLLGVLANAFSYGTGLLVLKLVPS
ncbi:MAG: hypothetical protein VX265_14150 [Myxococcota bacterium]|nr:hypothetical protein [Myxococcota bacterium]MEC8424589.1 hypothetical protein [Myxococcota bacterium]